MDESEKSSNELVKALQNKRRRSVSLTSGKGQKAPALNPFVNETRCLTPYEYFKVCPQQHGSTTNFYFLF